MLETVGGGFNIGACSSSPHHHVFVWHDSSFQLIQLRRVEQIQNEEEDKISMYLICAGVGCVVVAALLLIIYIYLQRSREKRLIELAENKHRRKVR
ncbi:unnamed protein product [Cylicostephanus goldi]|uniref:Uncharacterized protein n=1 Tax=Cylicostephanus goldi TaxID=71465 RepID=A0A3P6S5Y8_CYLGO|nr:unnamed protein product [Cylicostephanus goldi]